MSLRSVSLLLASVLLASPAFATHDPIHAVTCASIGDVEAPCAAWESRYTGISTSANDIALSADGATAFVAGRDYITWNEGRTTLVAYATSDGSTRWTDTFAQAGAWIEPYAIATDDLGSRVFTAGAIVRQSFIAAHGAETGELLWTSGHQPGGGAITSLAVSPDGATVVATGSAAYPKHAQTFAAAYDAATGERLWAHVGDDEFGAMYHDLVIDPSGSRVFATGRIGTGTWGSNVLVQGWDVESGNSLWTTTFGDASVDHILFNHGSALAMDPSGTSLLVAGTINPGPETFSDFATLRLDAATGRALWVRTYSGPGANYDEVVDVAVTPDAQRVVATGGSIGALGMYEYATLAYDLASGETAWEARFTHPYSTNSPEKLALSPSGDRVFVTGTSYIYTPGNADFATLGYDVATGAETLRVRYAPTNSYDFPAGIVASEDRVIVTGQTRLMQPMGEGRAEMTTLAYDV